MINKQTSIYSIILTTVIVAFLIAQLPKLQFDYELENFFPNDDPDLTYYQEFSETFGHDNDYLLLGFENEAGLFTTDFLTSIDSGLTKTSQLYPTIRVFSPTSIKFLAQTPMGVIPIPLLHNSNADKLKKDSTKLYQHSLYREMFVSKSGSSLKAIVIHKRFESKEAADDYVDQIKNIFASQIPKVRVAGKAVAQTAFVNAVKKDFTKFILIALTLITLWLIVFIRHFVLILCALLISGLSVVATIGLMAFIGKEVDVLSSLIPTILLVVSMSNIIHLFSHFQYEYKKTQTLTASINQAVKQVGVATLLTSITTAIGFLTLIAINVTPIIDLGVYAAVGILISFLITYFLFPSIITLVKPKVIELPEKNGFFPNLMQQIFTFVRTKRRTTLILTITSLVFCLIGLSRLQIDAYLVDDLPKNDLVKSDFLFFDQEFSGSKPFTLSIWSKVSSNPIYSKDVILEIDKIEQLVKIHTQAGDLISPVTMVKLANQNLHRASSAHFQLPETQRDWKRAFQHIRRTHIEQRSTKVSTKSLAQITGYFQDLGSRDATKKHDQLLRALNQEVNHELIGYRLTGTTLLIDKSHALLSSNLIKGLGFAIFIVGIIAGLLFRTWRLVLITLIPNVIPILMVAAVMGYFAIPLNLSTSVIFAISFGIVVDDTIHFLSQFKHEYLNGKSKEDAIQATLFKTGRPILMTTIILTSGFMVFCFSSFSATFYMGLFVSLSFVTALIADLYLLPTLLIWWLPESKKIQ